MDDFAKQFPGLAVPLLQLHRPNRMEVGRAGVHLDGRQQDRIVETPVNADDTEIRRNPRSGFIAFVPPGSIKKGEALVTTGTTAGGGKDRQ